MKRRDFMVVAMLGAASAMAYAQQPTKLWRIGYLGDGTPAARGGDLIDFRAGLAELGYIEGRNIVLEVRWTDGVNERRTILANELARLNVDVIVTHGAPAALAAKAASRTIPIVIAAVADILNTGLVSSLARPGGNVTGMSDHVTEVAAKNVELLKEILPNVQFAGLIWEGDNPGAQLTADAMRAAAQRLKLRLQLAAVTSIEQLERAMESVAAARAGAVIVVQSPLTVGSRTRIAQLALQKQLPMIAGSVQFTEAGALVSYGSDHKNRYRHAAVFVDKILKGTKPSDIPVEQPTKYELIINIKTAKAVGIVIPPSVLLRADRTIN